MVQTIRDVKINDGSSESGKSVFLEEAITQTGFGLYQITVALFCGLSAFSGSVAIYVVSFILPTLSCDFEMTSAEQTLITSSGFLGMILSTHLSGYWGDVYGRRHLLWRCCLAVGLFLAFMAFAPNAIWFIVILFFDGFASAGINVALIVYLSENCSNHHRGNLLIILSVITYSPFLVLPILSGVILPLDINWKIGAGLTISPWGFLLLVCSLLNLVSAIAIFLLPESPKFVLAKGDVSKTMATLRTMYHINTWKPKNLYPVSSVILDPDDISIPVNSEGFLTGIWKQNAMLFSRDYLKYSLFQSFVCMVGCGWYNLVFMWLPQWNSKMTAAIAAEGKGLTLCDTFQCEPLVEPMSSESDKIECAVYSMSTFSMNIYIGAACCLLITPIMKLADCFEKRNIIVYLQLGSVIGFFGVIFAKSIILTNVLLGSAAVLLVVTFPLCMNIIVDFFPTNLRSTATSLGLFTARLGSAIISQIMGAAQQCYCYYLFYCLVIILLGTVLMVVLMPLRKKNQSEC